MIRAFAAISIAAAFAFAGRYIAMLEFEKEALVREILQILNVIETRLRFTATPVSQLLELIEKSGCDKIGFIGECKKEMQNGASFHSAWKKSVKNCKRFCFILSEESRHLIAMGDDIGVTDIEGQLSCCGYYKQFFEKKLREREEKSRQSSKLFPPLGILMGLSAALFLLA